MKTKRCFTEEQVAAIRTFQAEKRRRAEEKYGKVNNLWYHYRLNYGRKCPMCGAEHLSKTFIKEHYGQVHMQVNCPDCNKTWVDIYQLSGFKENES